MWIQIHWIWIRIQSYGINFERKNSKYFLRRTFFFNFFNFKFMSQILLLLPIFSYVDPEPNSEYVSGSIKLLLTLRIRIHNTAFTSDNKRRKAAITLRHFSYSMYLHTSMGRRWTKMPFFSSSSTRPGTRYFLSSGGVIRQSTSVMPCLLTTPTSSARFRRCSRNLQTDEEPLKQFI